MNIGRIIGNFFSKTKNNPPADSWGGWLDTPEGKRWEGVGIFVYEKLEDARVSVKKRLIIMDGKKLTLNQATARIMEKTEYERAEIKEHVILWLEEASDAIERDSEDADDDVIDEITRAWVKAERSLAEGH
jgi:hypothetical protein